jgi:hypothetical protein
MNLSQLTSDMVNLFYILDITARMGEPRHIGEQMGCPLYWVAWSTSLFRRGPGGLERSQYL